MSTTSRTTRYDGPARRPVVLLCVLVAFAAALALPWAVPGVPRLLGQLVPTGQGSTAVVEDPPVPPPTAAPHSATGTALRSLRGVRLAAAGVPQRVIVSRLSVRSQVVPIAATGATLVPPADPQVLGWWRDGAVPGAARGTAVLTGHTVHTGGGALDHLGALVEGDVVRVRTANGSITYGVTSVRTLTTAELARRSEQLFRGDGPGRLLMVSCTDWTGSKYLSNTVVLAAPVG